MDYLLKINENLRELNNQSICAGTVFSRYAIKTQETSSRYIPMLRLNITQIECDRTQLKPISV